MDEMIIVGRTESMNDLTCNHLEPMRPAMPILSFPVPSYDHKNHKVNSKVSRAQYALILRDDELSEKKAPRNNPSHVSSYTISGVLNPKSTFTMMSNLNAEPFKFCKSLRL